VTAELLINHGLLQETWGLAKCRGKEEINTAEARAPSVQKDKIMNTQHFLE